MSQWLFFGLWYYTFFRTYVFIDDYIIHGNPVPDLFLRTDPLSGVISTAASRAFTQEILWWGFMVGFTLIAGRAFCGWICPLGTWMDIYDRMGNFWNRFATGNHEHSGKAKRVRNQINTFRRFMAWKYYILIAMMAAALFSVSFSGYLDPLCIMVRTFTFSVKPWLGEIEILSAGRNYLFGYGFTQAHFFNYNIFSGALFLGILGLSRYYKRFWCRALCPLGALLGALGKISLLKISVDPDTCTSCLKCSKDCKMGAIDFPDRGRPVANYHKEECIQCFGCVDVCPQNSVKIHPNIRFWQQSARPNGRLWNSSSGGGEAGL